MRWLIIADPRELFQWTNSPSDAPLGKLSTNPWRRDQASAVLPPPDARAALSAYGAFRRSPSEVLSPPSIRICIAATAIITPAVTKSTTASIVLLGKVKTNAT